MLLTAYLEALSYVDAIKTTGNSAEKGAHLQKLVFPPVEYLDHTQNTQVIINSYLYGFPGSP